MWLRISIVTGNNLSFCDIFTLLRLSLVPACIIYKSHLQSLFPLWHLHFLFLFLKFFLSHSLFLDFILFLFSGYVCNSREVGDDYAYESLFKYVNEENVFSRPTYKGNYIYIYFSCSGAYLLYFNRSTF